MPGAESVTIEFSDAVVTMPVTGKRSIASGALTLPCCAPFFMRRAAVRWAMPMPSPSRMMTFFARRPTWLMPTTSKLPSAVTTVSADCLAVTGSLWTPTEALV